MIEDFRQGDIVSVVIPKENRDWGYNPCPDGTHAVVLGYAEISYGRTNGSKAPGIYPNSHRMRIRLPDGKEYAEFSSRLTVVDRDPHAQPLPNSDQKLRDLPDLPFWEGDRVNVNGRESPLMVIRVDYDYLTSTRDDGSPYPIYQVSSDEHAGWHTYAAVQEMTLVSRGKVWQYYHNEPLTFSSLKEEADFWLRLGKAHEVPNPKDGLYHWTKDEVLDAIRQGIVHGFTMGNGLFGTGPYISAHVFDDPDVGARVAAATLIGYAWMN